MHKQPKVYIAGHSGMAGSAIHKALIKEGYSNFLTRTHKELDLVNQGEVREFFRKEKPDQVYLAAARVGGIHANNEFPANFIYENLMIQTNVIHEAWRSGVKKILFLGSSCIYPKSAKQPLTEDVLLSGYLEPTNEPYAISKIAGIKMCESYNRQYGESHGVDFRSAMPTNLYGPGDNYHQVNSHVIPGLIRRFHEAKLKNMESVDVWGSGKPRREFLYIDDMASACLKIMNIDKSLYQSLTSPMNSHINVGSGLDLTIKELAIEISNCVGFKGVIKFDESRLDGTMQKLMDNSKLTKIGWSSTTSLKEGLNLTYSDFKNSLQSI